MAGGDIAQVCIIFIVFALLVLTNIISAGLENIKENWHLYKCNPLAMPFAGTLGFDGTQNFVECIETMQTAYMSVLLQPINLNFSMMTGIVGELTGAISGIKEFIDRLRTMIEDVTLHIFGAFGNILGGFIGTQRTVTDIVGRLLGLVVLTMNAMKAGVMTGQSANNGPPGQLLRAICFAPDTLVEMNDGSSKEISQCKAGDVLANDNRVSGCMQLDNVHKDGTFRERLYSFDKGHVSGPHLVYDDGMDNFVHVKDSKSGKFMLSEDNYPVLHCLITTHHIIQSGGHIFHDWEDNVPQ